MENFPKILESKVLVRFPDCDPFNHLNNSKYIDYTINAREDQLIEIYQFDIYKIAKETGLSWVVSQNQIAYLSPAFLMEKLTIQTRLIKATDKNLEIEAIIYNYDKTKLKTVLWTRLTHFNLRTNKSETHSDDLNSFFKQIENPLEKPITFEERVATIVLFDGLP